MRAISMTMKKKMGKKYIKAFPEEMVNFFYLFTVLHSEAQAPIFVAVFMQVLGKLYIIHNFTFL